MKTQLLRKKTNTSGISAHACKPTGVKGTEVGGGGRMKEEGGEEKIAKDTLTRGN
jgi:hypothetical protein